MKCNHNGEEGIGRMVFAETFAVDGGCVECLLAQNQMLIIVLHCAEDVLSVINDSKLYADDYNSFGALNELRTAVVKFKETIQDANV